MIMPLVLMMIRVMIASLLIGACLLTALYDGARDRRLRGVKGSAGFHMGAPLIQSLVVSL